jgi:NAD(P)-dependent dehydrogenase (short-subunit alcohol dehydrogenase family)
MSEKKLADRIAVVTGASRGAGKGIALALGELGATVYVTGRTRREGDAALPGTIDATAQKVSELGGRGIAVECGHDDDAAVQALFEQVDRDAGRLDILVNNAAFIHDELIEDGAFWEKSLDLVRILDVGLRSAYVSSYYGAPLMVRQRSGLIVNTSSYGARCYMHGAAYGAQKAGLDKMAWDMAVDLRPYDVAAVSIWMGLLHTERTAVAIAARPDRYAELAKVAETPEFTGHLIAALWADPARMERSGQTWIAAELAREYGLTDAGDKQPPSYRKSLGEPVSYSEAIVA